MKKVLFLIIILALAAGGYYWYTNYYCCRHSGASRTSVKIIGSGVIEAETIAISSETGGRIIDLYGREGDVVEEGMVLVRLDDTLLKARRVELEAAISTAKANLMAVQTPPRDSDIAVAEAALQYARAQEAGAEQVWQQMVTVSENPQALKVAIEDLQAQIRLGLKQIEIAEVEQKSADIQEEDAARDQSAVGKILHQITQKQGLAADVGVQLAKAKVQALRTQLRHLNDQVENPIALQVQARQAEQTYHLTGAAVALAETQLQVAQIGPRAEDIAVAEAQVQVAESARALLENQVKQLTLTAPTNGVITTRTVKPGEIAIPGAILFSLGDLEHVTLRVFIPETQIGKVHPGQAAVVTVDSLERPFEGVVTYIASEAEFTPQNVQMPEERVNLVFAVEISLDNPDHLLKPGMPADAEILIGDKRSGVSEERKTLSLAKSCGVNCLCGV